MKTAKEILNDCFLGVIDFNEKAALAAMEEYAKQFQEPKPTLNILLDQVLPSTGVLMKHCNGGWDFYMTDNDFLKGESFMAQKTNEDFCRFINRLIKEIIEIEKGIEEPLTTIDYAIWENQ